MGRGDGRGVKRSPGSEVVSLHKWEEVCPSVQMTPTVGRSMGVL